MKVKIISLPRHVGQYSSFREELAQLISSKQQKKSPSTKALENVMGVTFDKIFLFQKRFIDWERINPDDAFLIKCGWDIKPKFKRPDPASVFLSPFKKMISSEARDKFNEEFKKHNKWWK